MKKRMYKIMALAMTAAMVVPMAAQTTAFAADDKEITYWNIAVESPDKDIVTAAVDKFNKETESGYTVNQVSIQNDTYKEKLVIAMSSGECPDMYSSWSGGPMYEVLPQLSVIIVISHVPQLCFKQLPATSSIHCTFYHF